MFGEMQKRLPGPQKAQKKKNSRDLEPIDKCITKTSFERLVNFLIVSVVAQLKANGLKVVQRQSQCVLRFRFTAYLAKNRLEDEMEFICQLDLSSLVIKILKH